MGTTKRGKGSKIMAITDRHGRPVAIHIDSATPHEVTLVETTLAHRLVQKMPKRLIGDNAYESNFLGMLHLACWLILLRVFMG